MRRRPFKLVVLGDWHSGRSSVVAVLSGKPCPNHPGIQVTRWTEPETGVAFDVWDVNSRSALEALGQTFISGSEALVAVADDSRPTSVESARLSLRAALQLLGPRPALLLLNQRNGSSAGSSAESSQIKVVPGVEVRTVSARTGNGVLPAFRFLAERLGAEPSPQPTQT